MGFKSLKATDPLRGGTLLFYHEVTIDLKFPKKVAANYFSILTY